VSPTYLTGSNFDLDYSFGKLPTIDEVTGLDESLGLVSSIEDTHKIVYGFTGGFDRGDTTPLSGAGSPTAIDWNGDTIADTGLAALDVNNLDFDGCEGFGDVYDDHNEWANLVYNFRGSGGASFDAIKSPTIPPDLNPLINAEILAAQDHFSPERPFPDGTQTEGAGGNYLASFTLSTCDPVTEAECDKVALKKPGGEDFYVNGKTIQLTMKKISGENTDTAVPFVPPIASHFSDPERFDQTGIFANPGSGVYETEIDLDALRELLGSEADAAGSYAVYFTDLDSGNLLINLVGDQFYLCTNDLVGNECSATVQTLVNGGFDSQYTGRLTLVEPAPTTPTYSGGDD